MVFVGWSYKLIEGERGREREMVFVERNRLRRKGDMTCRGGIVQMFFFPFCLKI